MTNLQFNSNIKYAGASDLENGEKFLINYNQHITNLISTSIYKFKPKNLRDKNVLDFGSGRGNLASLLQDKTKVVIDCLEIDPMLASASKALGFKVFGNLNELRTKYATIYSSNVLEHIQDDIEILKQLHNAICEEGILVLYVPAYMTVFSELDTAVGHYRRYSKRELIKKLEIAGFEILKIQNVDSIGYFASLLIKVLGFKKRMNLGSPKSLILYDTYIFPISKLLDNLGFKKLVGKNIFCVAQRR